MPKGYWTDERIQEEANKFSERKAFKKNSSAYWAAVSKGILDRVCSHMPAVSNRPYTLEEIIEIANKCKTKIEFIKNNVSAYNAARKRDDYEDIVKHMKVLQRKPYTIEEIKQEANKYDTPGKFQKECSSGYAAALNMGVLKQVCSHMHKVYESWTIEKIQKEADKYKYRGEFQKNSPRAWQTAQRMGILNEICNKMEILSGESLPEIELFDVLSSIYPEIRKLRDRKVNIENKPYIKGFDIDMFILSLNKGIEFDGTRYHSFEYMRTDKMKKGWPDEDVRNYHEIKDSWFASKGIQILHIKEEQWNKNKNACIRQCLDFLSK